MMMKLSCSKVMYINGKMFQVTTLLVLGILNSQAIPIGAVNTAELDLPSPEINYNQDINQVDSYLLCSESVYNFYQIHCNHSRSLLRKDII